MNIACVSVGLQEHGHNISFSPFAAETVIETVHRSLGERVTCRLFDMVLLGLKQTMVEVQRFGADVLLVSVPVSGYWWLGVQLCEWAEEHSLPVLAGGYHFNVPGSNIPVLAAERRIAVCYGDGRITAPVFVEHLLDPGKVSMSAVPNLYFLNGSNVEKTFDLASPFGLAPYPALPLEVHDPRAYWRLLAQTPLHHSGMDIVDGSLVGRTIVGPELLRGCTYRTARLKTGQTVCEFCTITDAFASVDAVRYWQLMRQAYDYVLSIPWDGAPAIRVYQTNDDMGSNIPFIRSVWERRPGWFNDVMQSKAKLGLRAYAWHVMSEELAKMLHDIGVRWVCIGADGKEGFTSDPSPRHPLVRTLENCRRFGLAINLAFVLGREGQTWSDIYQWLKFRNWLAANYRDVLAYMSGWVHVIAPGSPAWVKLAKEIPSLDETDCGDDPNFLEQVRLEFIRRCTRLCAEGISAEQARNRLYALALEFELDYGETSSIPHSFMLQP